MQFLRLFQHLLPRGQAFRITVDKTLRRVVDGIAEAFVDVREFADQIWVELMPSTTSERSLAEFEQQFGLSGTADLATRRIELAAAWAAQGGQSPSYIQSVLQAAGFNVYVHDWWQPGTGTNPSSNPYDPRDPRSYTEVPLIGDYQCKPSTFATQPQCSALPSQPQCNAFLANDPRYIVNKDLTRRPPPPVPSDPDYWPFFFYIGAQTFPDHALVPAARRDELERLVLKMKPTQNWVVMLIAYGEVLTTEADVILTTEDDRDLVA